MRKSTSRTPGALVALVMTLWIGGARAQDLQVIELRYRLAEQVIPTLQPLLERGGVLTGMDSTLFVRASPENFEQIRQAVALLDRAPRQLLISVGQGTVETSDEAAVRGSATVGSGDIQVGVNRPPGSETGVSIQGRQDVQRADLRNVSSIRTIEGNEAYVATGQLVPLSSTQVVPTRRGPVVSQSTGYRDVSSGFYVTVRVNGDLVTLDIAPRQQRVRSSAHGPIVDAAGSHSTVTGRLGEWLPLDAVRESASDDTTGLLVWGRRSSESQYGAWVKVDEVP